MANPKGMKTWRRASLSTHALRKPQVVAKAYKEWLCHDRGWFTNIETCRTCHGDGKKLPDVPSSPSRYRTWKRQRAKEGKPPYYTQDEKETCWNCNGAGTLPIPNNKPNFAKADAYIAQMRDRLDCIAEAAVKGIERRLRILGFRPLIMKDALQTVEAYDHFEAQQTALRAELDAVEDAEQIAYEAAEAAFFAMSAEEQVEDMNRSDEESLTRAKVRELNRKAETIRQQLWRGHTHYRYWYRPGDYSRVLYAGIDKPQQSRYAPKIKVTLVIEPGRAPDDTELDTIVAAGIAEFDQPELLVAA